MVATDAPSLAATRFFMSFSTILGSFSLSVKKPRSIGSEDRSVSTISQPRGDGSGFSSSSRSFALEDRHFGLSLMKVRMRESTPVSLP